MLEKEKKPIQHWLEIEDDRGQRSVILEATTCTIGRDSTNSIVLHSMLVSRQHAILLRMTTPETDTHFFRLIDGNLQGKRSTNGIAVNDQVCFSHDLKHGDSIVFGGDVNARYCNNATLADRSRLTAEAEVTGVLTNLRTTAIFNNFASDRQLETSTESSLVRLASFPELLSNPILEIDLSGAITYLNPAAVTQFPDIRETKLQHPILAGIVLIVQNGKEKFFAREVEVGDKVFEQSVHYIAESDLIRSYLIDVTQRKQIEIALRESEAKNRALLNAIPDLILRISKDGTYLDYIPAKDSEMSATCSQMLGKNEYEVMPKQVAQQRMHYVELALSTGKPQIFEYQLPINGEIREEEARIVLSGNDEVLAIVRDITERKQVEALLQKAHDELEIRVAQRTAQLSQANEQLKREISDRTKAEEALRSSIATNRALLNAIPDSMFRINNDGIFVNYKAAKNNKLPLPDDDILGKSLYQVLPPNVAQLFMQGVKQVLATGNIQIFEYQSLVESNLLDYEARIVVSAEDEVMAIVRDITERKRAEADIRNALEKEKELNELKSRFVSMASHEFRTPLTTILSSAELLQDYSDRWDEEKKLKHFLRIQTAVTHMTGLLNDVLLIGKAEAGKLEFKPTPLNLVSFCRELTEEMQLAAENHTIVFCTRGDCTPTCMDEKLLRQILSNLLSNAIKYSPSGGTVKLELIGEQKTVMFHIQDRGIGIPQADLTQLFDSFHRASNVGTISGTGLGLAIVKKAVDLHNGQIFVKSEVGVGTTFTIKLPLHPEGLE
ncbi:MAG TPA: histidine kinase [Cyanobacteria bacterium UBA11049]|nr:histidine kinase [Cyanobacteria bacterium UBA11049]